MGGGKGRGQIDVMWKQFNSPLLTVKLMEEQAVSQGVQAASRSWKRHRNRSHGKNVTSDTSILACWGPCQTSNLQTERITHLCCWWKQQKTRLRRWAMGTDKPGMTSRADGGAGVFPKGPLICSTKDEPRNKNVLYFRIYHESHTLSQVPTFPLH